jgi:hypothetical protein
MNVEKDVLYLLFQLKELHSMSLVPQASDAEIQSYSIKHNIYISDELRQWLKVCNGFPRQPGRTFGINQKNEHLEIVRFFKIGISWHRKGWLPMASDQCGSYYVLDTSTLIGQTHPVYFIEHTDYEKPQYVVASGLWKFLRFFFMDELLLARHEEGYWPFDKERVTAEDPDIVLCTTAPLPWKVDADDEL